MSRCTKNIVLWQDEGDTVVPYMVTGCLMMEYISGPKHCKKAVEAQAVSIERKLTKYLTIKNT